MYLVVKRNCIFLPPPPPRVRVRATVKLSAAFLHDESPIIKGGNKSAIAPKICMKTLYGEHISKTYIYYT